MPTLSFLSPGSALPMPIASNPIAAAPAGEGDAFAAMLAGLTVAPAAEPGTALKSTLETPGGLPLPQVRQDPAAWLPGEETIPAEPLSPIFAHLPAPLQPTTDCEMPAFDVPMPHPEDVHPVSADAPMPLPVQTVTKVWPLRLSSALTPLGTASITSDAKEIAPEVDAEDANTAAPPAQPASTPLPDVMAMPLAQPKPLPIPPADMPAIQEAIAQPTYSASLDAPKAAASRPVTALSSAIAGTPDVATPAAGQAPAVLPDASNHDNSGQQPAPQPQHGKGESDAGRMAPDMARQIAQLVEQAAGSKPDTGAKAPDPVAVVMPAPAPQAPAAAAPAQPTLPSYQPAPVDLGRAEWVQAMVDRIAELPQAEGRREAQIQLLPDALGKVAVSIVERDEQMQVTLNADTAQARQLLSDQASRLQELAEARGLRFAQTEVGGGQSQDRRSPHDQQPQTPQRPRPAPAGRAAEPQPQGDLIA